MNIVFKQVRLKNFMSFEDSTIRLDDSGYTLVKGINNNPDDMAINNGSGKSSLWDAISYALTGETIRGSNDIVNKATNQDAEVTLDFSVDGNDYQIIRSKTAEKAKSGLRLFVNGKDESGKGIRDAQAILKSHLPDITSLLLGSVIIFGQGLPQGFANNTPSGRKEILEKLSKSDFMIEDLKNRISNRKTELSKIIRGLEDDKLSKTSEKKLLEQQISIAQEKLKNLVAPEANIIAINDLKKDVETLEEKLNSTKALLVDITKEQGEVIQELQALNAEKIVKYNEIDTKYKDILQEASNKISTKQVEVSTLANQIRQYDSVVDICPTCHQKLVGVTKVDTTQMKDSLRALNNELLSMLSGEQELKKEISAEKQKIDTEISTKNVVLSNRKLELDKYYNDYYNTVCTCELNIKNTNAKISNLETIVSNYNLNKQNQETVISDNTARVGIIENEITKIEEELNNVQLHLDVVNKMNTIASRDFRGYLLNSIIVFIDRKAKEYSQKIFETDKLSFCLDGNNISITYCGKEFESLSGGEKQKVSLIVQFAIRDMLCSYLNFSSNILVLDEIVDFLDKMGADRIINLISTELSDITSIFFITHHEDLLFPCDREIIITKDKDGISRI